MQKLGIVALLATVSLTFSSIESFVPEFRRAATCAFNRTSVLPKFVGVRVATSGLRIPASSITGTQQQTTIASNSIFFKN